MTVLNSVLLTVVSLLTDSGFKPKDFDSLTTVDGLIFSVSNKFYSSIVIGALPAENGISISTTGGAAVSTDFEKGDRFRLSLVCNAKNVSQFAASEALNEAHATLTKIMEYPKTDTWQITNIRTLSAPAYIGREQNSQYLYGSGLEVALYYPNRR